MLTFEKPYPEKVKQFYITKKSPKQLLYYQNNQVKISSLVSMPEVNVQ